MTESVFSVVEKRLNRFLRGLCDLYGEPSLGLQLSRAVALMCRTSLF
jgi:hypothetical protein